MIKRIPPPLPSVLMLGTVSQIGQVLLFRELLMIFHGNEISIGLILSAWLVWVGTGSRLGTFLVERLNRPISLLILSAVGVLLLLPLTILTIRVLRGFFEVLPGAYLSLPDMLISCLLLMAPVCLLLGAQFVLLSRIWRESKSVEDTSCGGKAYVGEAVGNMLGGILFTFLMVHHLNSFQSSILAGTLMVAAVLSMGRKGDRGISYLSKWHRHILWGVLGLAILTFPFLVRLDRWAYLLQWRFFSPYHRLVETVQSKYGTISIVQREDQYSFFQSGFLVFTSAGEETVRAGFEEQEAATFAHLSMVQHRKPERILLIGGGLRGTLTEIAKHPVKMIDYIELDEVLTEAARSYISPATLETLADPRVHLIHTDGRLFVKTAKEKYDMIIIDVPDPSTAVLNRYYTKEFFLESKSLLNSDGVLVIGATSTPDLRGNSVANRNTTIYHTLKSVFAHVLPVGERFMFFFATETEGQISAEIPALQKRFLDRNIKTEGFTHHHYHTLLQKAQLRRVNWVVRNHGRSRRAHLEGPTPPPLSPGALVEQELGEKNLPPVNRNYFLNFDFKPIGYFYTVMFWHELTRTDHPDILKWLLHVKLWWIPVLFALPVLVAIGVRMRSRSISKGDGIYPAVLFAVFTTGLSTMALQIALLFSFQSIYGFVYEMVGLIIAMFMGGLALGTFIANRYVTDKANLRTLSFVQAFIALIAVLIALALPLAASVRSPAVVFLIFSTFTFFGGLINGVDFPLATSCCMAINKNAEKSTGLVYGVELFGACLGAVFASVVIAPILGIIACCLFAGIANASAFIVVFMGKKAYV